MDERFKTIQDLHLLFWLCVCAETHLWLLRQRRFDKSMSSWYSLDVTDKKPVPEWLL